MGWACYVAWIGDGRGVLKVLVVKPEGKKKLGRTRRRWEDNMKMDLKGLVCGVCNGLSSLKIETICWHL
jgi:hypothetical protein